MPKKSNINAKEIVLDAKNSGRIIAGFNIFSLDDAYAVIGAAEELNYPVMLMVNKVATGLFPVEVWGDVLRVLADNARTPVIVHLDHTTDFDVLRRAASSGFDSLMFDGSQLPLQENIAKTREAVELAHANKMLLEAEIGAVGYSDGAGGSDYVAAMTDPDEAARFARESGLDWMAISIGNVHRMEKKGAKIDFSLLAEIEKAVDIPLVLHGASGIADTDIIDLRGTRVAKVNIGTTLRMAFGKTLVNEIRAQPGVYDRTVLFKKPLEMVRAAAKESMTLLGAGQEK